VAETERPKILFETELPSRYLIPPEDVREDEFIKSEKTTRCSYKGIVSLGGGAPESLLTGVERDRLTFLLTVMCSPPASSTRV
jgi:hypothetical protein